MYLKYDKYDNLSKYLSVHTKSEAASYINHFLLVLVRWRTLTSSRNNFVLTNWKQRLHSYNSYFALLIQEWNISLGVVRTD